MQIRKPCLHISRVAWVCLASSDRAHTGRENACANQFYGFRDTHELEDVRVGLIL